MSVAQPHQTVSRFSKASDPKQEIIDSVGDLDSVVVMQNMVLVATYIRPEKTAGGLYLPETTIEEDLYQGKVGLVLKMGPAAFQDSIDEPRFYGMATKVHDWCVYRVGDAWDLTLRKVPCRLIRDSNIRLIINDPEEIF